MDVAFGEYVFDFDTRKLRLRGERVQASPKALELLRVLLEARPRAVSTQGLLGRLWPDSIVVEANLADLVAELRGALGEDRESAHFIRKAEGFGYAFAGDEREPGSADEEARWIRCRLGWDGGRASLAPGAHVLGRDPEASVIIDATTVSKRHARLTVREDGVAVEDLESRNGTWVRGQRIDARVELADGETFRLGSLKVTLRLARLDDPTASVDSGVDAE